MEQRLSVVTLGVSDLERSRRFYEDGLGWRRANQGDEIVFFQAGGLVFSLYPRAALAADVQVAALGQSQGAITLAHNVRDRDDVATVLAEAEAAGATILKPAQEVFWGGVSGYFADPDGHLWEVAWNPHWELAADGQVVMPVKSGE
jgi:catechol 2,3-dioxygenase-like lactoylglutathione lyase family enzyme